MIPTTSPWLTSVGAIQSLISNYIGDIQVLINKPPTSRQHGLDYKLITHGTLTSLKFQLWPTWDWVYIARHLKDLEKLVGKYEENNLMPGGHVRFW